MHLEIDKNDLKFKQLVTAYIIKNDLISGQSRYKLLYNDLENNLGELQEYKKFLTLYHLYVTTITTTIKVKVAEALEIPDVEEKRKRLIEIMCLEKKLENVLGDRDG